MRSRVQRGVDGSQLGTQVLQPRPVLSSVRNPPSQLVKRGIDIAGAVVGLVMSAPVVALAGFAVWRKMGRPVFYTQERPGRDEHIIRVHKLRTMTDATRPDGTVVPDIDRVTPIGRFLRKTSIDELPQLWNVLKGEMSLVGPRPLLREYLELYNPAQRRRHEVKPGVTGWSQVQRHAIQGWSDQLELDIWYVNNQSLRLDLKIMAMTVVDCLSLVRGGRSDYSTTSLSRSIDAEPKFGGSSPSEPRLDDVDGERFE